MLWENIKSMAEQLVDKEATCMLQAVCVIPIHMVTSHDI